MHISTILVVLTATIVTANTHNRLICLGYSQSVLGPGTSTASTNDPATIAACNDYRARNTGSRWWDTCPDCNVIQVNEIKECESLGKHMGGNEFHDYCKAHGANASV